MIKHIHKYKRFNLTRKPDKPAYYVFKCILPNCPHYVRFDLVEGKFCICHKCNEAFLMTKLSMRLAKPHCIDCTKFEKKEDLDAIAEFIKNNLI